MEANNRGTQTPAPEDISSGAWRSEITPEMRDRARLKMFVTLTKNRLLHVPLELDKLKQAKLKDIAVGFEARIYANAINKDDYIRRINLKLLLAEKLLLTANTDQGRTTESPSHPIPSVVVNSSTHSGLLDSTAGLTSPVDWQEEVFEKIKSMKDSYLPELIELNRKISVQQETIEKSAKRSEQYEILGSFIKSMIKFLQSTKSEVKSYWKDDVLEYERKLETILASKNRTPAPLMQPTLRTAVDLPEAEKITSQGGSASAQNMKRDITVICCEMGSTSKRQKGELAHGSAAGGIKSGDITAICGEMGSPAIRRELAHGSAAGGIKSGDITAICGEMGSPVIRRELAHGSAAGGIKSGDITAICGEMGSPAIRRESHNGILEEILWINQQLYFTLVSITGKAVSTSNRSGGGTMVKFFLKTPFLRPDIRAPFSLSPVAPLTLLVPNDYPASSPIIVDNPRVDASCSDESQVVGIRAWTMFNASIGSLMQPVTVAGLGRLWDYCVHRVIAEYAGQWGPK